MHNCTNLLILDLLVLGKPVIDFYFYILELMSVQVIDGLPAEFVLGKDGNPPRKAFMEAMPYTQSLLANGMAIGYHAKAAPPTVTMPRLKVRVISHIS